MASMSNPYEIWTFTYDANGMRTTRSDGNGGYTYIYNGDQLQEMRYGYDILYFSYDANGVPQTVSHNTTLNQYTTVYQYVTNQQGDVIGIQDYNGNVYASYSYNAWGKPISSSDASSHIIETLNPLRYRGYVYDQETELYYVGSRYYDPEIGRWINADNMITTGSDLTGLNLFAYCGNNPVNRVDPSGQFWIPAIIKAVVVVVAVAAVVAKVVCTVKEIKRVQKELDSLPEPTADITESFRETLKTNANTVKETTKNEGIIESGKQFYNKVRNKGEWDLKQLPEYQGTFQFNDLVIQGQDIGNINFGYTGKALGLPDSVLLAGAGFAQIKAGTSNFSFIMVSNGDDLRDQMYIMYGIMLYNEDH